MTAPPPDLEAFHLGFVVRDIDAVADRYSRMLGIERWMRRELDVAPSPFNPHITGARLNIAFGRGGRQTFELIQVVEGRTQHSDFLDAHGEGVQHIGFWTSDLKAAVTSAVEQGASIVWALIDERNQGSVQLTPGSSADAIISAMDLERVAYVDPGLTTVQFEFCGPAIGQPIRAWLADELARESQSASSQLSTPG
jgi:catechol 2,3-dioxygenase-like lactoylglutathione lyase family enzyme